MDAPKHRNIFNIFVVIAAYRDRDCINTIDDLFRKARRPDRVTAGVCWQYLSPEDDAVDPLGRWRDRCRLVSFPAAETEGVCWARSRAHALWDGEEAVLQIDSHMRFVDGWDEALLAMLADCPSERPILSNYPAAFAPPDRIESHVVSVIRATGFDQDGLLKQESVGYAPDRMGGKPRPSAFVAGGFLFGDSRWIAEVPYDPFLYFQGEESTLAARLFTHGWDVFTPNDVLAYHDYGQRPDRPRHWNDRPDWPQLNRRSVRRVRHLLGIEESSDPEVLRDIGRYGLGSRRSLAEYQAFAGVDFRRQVIGRDSSLRSE